MRVVVYEKMYSEDFSEMGIWRGPVFGTEKSFREYSVAWIHNAPVWHPDTRYLSCVQPLSVNGANLLHNRDMTFFPTDTTRNDKMSKKYKVAVRGRCVEFKVVWLEEL